MKEYLRCKACGFIMDKSSSPEICPACGIPKKVFEEYRYNISTRRKFVMDLDLHPIMLHFPQAITVFIPFFGLLSLITDASLGVKFLYAFEIITFLLPLAVTATFITGLIDGKNRFKKLGTPALKKKIFLATALLILTITISFLVYLMGVKEALFPVIGLSVLSLVIQAVLSRIGIKLISAFLPG